MTKPTSIPCDLNIGPRSPKGGHGYYAGTHFRVLGQDWRIFMHFLGEQFVNFNPPKHHCGASVAGFVLTTLEKLWFFNIL